MFVNIGENKWQIIISFLLGIIYLNIYNDFLYSFIFVIITSVILRKLEIDSIINKLIGKNNL